MQGREAWGFGVCRTRVQIQTLLPSHCVALGSSPTLGAVLWGVAHVNSRFLFMGLSGITATDIFEEDGP